MRDATLLAQRIKALPLTLGPPFDIARAISCAGGVAFEELSPELMLQARPGLFCAGEMLDWEAPTGGYLLSACFATGWAAGKGALTYLNNSRTGLNSGPVKG
jgi:predicted flavoprotein YhiN